MTYRIAVHPRRPERLALIDAAGKPTCAFGIGESHAEVTMILVAAGFVQVSDDEFVR